VLKLSTRGRYGLRAMVRLARGHGEGPVLMSAISKREEVSRKYLHTLLTALREAGLVTSARGARGGYSLARPPGEIRVSEVLEALEGEVVLVDCLSEEGCCALEERCSVRGVWKRMNDAVVAVLDDVTLADLVRDTPMASDGECAGARPARRRRARSRKGEAR